jgi:Flp pilus assembly protein TadD
LAATNQFNEADTEYCDARNLSPDAPDNYVNRGVLLLRMGRQPEAIEDFLCALELDPQQSSAEINLITIYLRAGRANDAFSHLHAAPLHDAQNSQRVATAIAASLAQQTVPSEVLKRFASRACKLSGGQPDLRAVVALIDNQRTN